jgi:hypothetical protein
MQAGLSSVLLGHVIKVSGKMETLVAKYVFLKILGELSDGASGDKRVAYMSVLTGLL